MIIVYPMLVSKAISENIVPGIAKTLESYIIVNAKDTIISNPAVRKEYNFKIKGRNLVMKENMNITETAEDDLYGKGGKTKSTTAEEEEAKRAAEKDRIQKKRDAIAWAQDEKRKRAAEEREKEKSQREKDKYEKHKRDAEERERIKKKRDAIAWAQDEKRKRADQDKLDQKAEREKEKSEREKEKHETDAEDKRREIEAKKADVDVKIQDNKALSIEPSFIEIDSYDKYGNPQKSSLGIKVIAFRVKSDVKLSRLILHDVKLKYFNAKIVALGRNILRRVWKFVDKWSGMVGDLTPSGDVRRDIIMGRTGHKGEGFVVLSKTEDIDDDFLNDVSKINRLFKLGWGNIVIVDNVNRIAYFCMKKFKGVCTAMSFAMIYQNFGALKVYQDLEDAKRQSSSIFKIRKPLSKVLAEWITDYRQEKYFREDK